MLKKFIIILILLTLNIISYIYLNNLINNKKTYEFSYIDKPILYLKKDITLLDINDFKFDDYFKILSFNQNDYKYTFDTENKNIVINIKNNNKEYIYPYELIEPEIITITEYVVEDKNDEDEYVDYSDTHIYYSCDYYEFDLGTDLSYIIQIVQDDIESYTNVTCDYSCLNPYQLGTYDIYFYNDYEKIIKTIKII